MSPNEVGPALWVLMVVCWYAIRLPFERRAKRRAVARTRRGWAERLRLAISFAGLGILPGVFVATGWPDYADHDLSWWRVVLGAAAAAAALVLFRLTHKALGRLWSVSLDIRNKHQLVTTGVYGRVRHPMYSAFWLMALAQFLLLPNWVAGAAGLIGFGILFASRIGPEERMMEEAFGEAYRSYRKSTARIIPGVF